MLKKFTPFVACALTACAFSGAALAGGLTIVTHGFNANMTWVNAMADAIAKRAGTPGVDVTRVNLVVTQSGSNLVVTMSPIAVAPEATFTSGEFVVGLDWTAIDSFAAASRQPTPEEIQDSVPTQTVAAAVFQYLQTWSYGGKPILAHPIHLAGHSRGAVLMASLATNLGQRGIYTDHLTTLDPYNVTLFGDAAPTVASTVVFADNIWQDSAFPSGKSLPGAFNQHLGLLGTTSNNHSYIHTYYFGTIDTSATGDGECSGCINPVWYTQDVDLHSRAQSGFWYSRIAGGDRTGSQAAAGLLSSLGGTAVIGSGGRQAVTVTQPAWPNAFRVQTNSLSITPNQSNFTEFDYQASGSSAQVRVYAADDRNPSHGGILLGTATLPPASSPTHAMVVWNTVPPARSEPYRIHLAITDLGAGGQTRYAYDANSVTVLAPPCPGDLNGDSVVDDSDFVLFAVAYDILDCAAPNMPANCPADLNGDGFVEDADFVIFAGAYDALFCP
ncbi:MAG: hypothetical protein KF691_00720 [Phycisphaeraceae bacterium]|nr:hypothetical protein [Phycisphaeraceae bacterium]